MIENISENEIQNSERRLKGSGVGSAVAIGSAYVTGCREVEVVERSIDPSQVDEELARLREAIGRSRTELEKLRERVARSVGQMEAAIFDAHIMILEDPLLFLEVTRNLRSRLVNVEVALSQVLGELTEQLGSVSDEVIRARTADIRDVGRRLLRNLGTPVCAELDQIQVPSILVAHDLSPSETAVMDVEKILGFVTEVGSRTSHTAIFARALGIPAVVGAPDAVAQIKNGDTVVIDAAAGDVILSPHEETLSSYHAIQKAFANFDVQLLKESSQASITQDGIEIHLAANIEFPAEIKIAQDHHAKGIGLYRTEYLFMNRSSLPDEEEQYQHYKQAAEAFPNHPVTIRTIDVGGDKFISSISMPKEMNPFLGLRAIRLSLYRPDLFSVQLRAILRASAHGQIRLLLPMVSTMEEVEASLFLIDRCKNELRERKLPFNEHMPVGIMIETPAAAMTTDILARKVDYFSIGTNDLIQYTMAADRVNEGIVHLYQPLHIGVLRLIKHVMEEGRNHQIEVGMCGEMAGDPFFLPIVLGLGITHLSMSARSIPQVNRMIRMVRYHDAKDMVSETLRMHSDSDVRNLLRERFGDIMDHLKPTA